MIVTGRRRKADGTVEVSVRCPLCSGKAEINPGLNVWNCWGCHRGGKVPAEWLTDLPDNCTFVPPRKYRKLHPKGEFSDLPPFAVSEIMRRGLSPEWVINQYNVVWDGERMAWPAGRGWSRRAVLPWETPKTLTVLPKGLIGQHRLFPGAHVVVVEGDYKAACIPLPWVGVGAMGTALTNEQVAIIKNSRPSSVIVLLDKGCLNEAYAMRGQLLPLDVSIRFPSKGGPDDIPRSELYQTLLGD